MPTISETMALTTFSRPRKANNSRITVRERESTVAIPMSRWLVAISSYSSTGTPVRPAVTPLNSGRFKISARAARAALIGFSEARKLPSFLTGRMVMTCCLPAFSRADGLAVAPSLEERVHGHRRCPCRQMP